MRKFLLILLASPCLLAQPALHHYGDMRLHPGATVGLHTSFVNDGPFEQTAGLVGLYGAEEMRIDGGFAPVFQDIEIMREPDVTLGVSFSVAGNLNFMQGDFVTDRGLPGIFVTLLQDAFTVGEGNASKVNGYATVLNRDRMVFPVGDAFQYRPLTLEGAVFPIAKCAYFREDPNNPSVFPPFRTDLKPRNIKLVSTAEFWRLEGSSTGQVTLNWNAESNLPAIADELTEIVLVGWYKSEGRWVELGTRSTAGDLDNGFAISEPITPDDYDILTFASLAEPQERLTLDNYFLSPNGDGINDVLIIEGLEASPNNNLQIYDRNGLKVFEMDNYTDQFSGTSNLDGLVFNAEKGLPEGVYFYLVQLFDLGLEYQGFLFLDR